VLWFAPLLFLVIRPVAVAPVVWLGGLSGMRRRLIAWFGIRGIGSIYYLSYAITHGVPEKEVGVLIGITLWVVAASIVVHGVSVKPLMRLYTKRVEQERSRLR
jgi:sodium/hydrogen antiporter